MGLALAGLSEGIARLSPDELTIYFTGQLAGATATDLHVARRTAIGNPFSTPMLIPAVDTASSESDPAVSSDGLTLWFTANRAGNGDFHIYIATRTSPLAEFNGGSLATSINATAPKANDYQPFITADGFQTIYVATRQP